MDLKVKTEELERIGLNPNAIYQISYDFPSRSKFFSKGVNQFLTSLRNSLNYTLKFKINAMQYLESCWIIEEAQLESAEAFLNELIKKFKEESSGLNLDKLFQSKPIENRIKIFPIFTTEEGHRQFENRKVEFLLEFAMEQINRLDRYQEKKKFLADVVWRGDRAYEIITTLKEFVKKNKKIEKVEQKLAILHEKLTIYRIEVDRIREEKTED